MNEQLAAARILLVTLSNIGDVVMTTPVLETLVSRFPAMPIDILADRRSSSLLRAHPALGELFHRDKRASWAAQWRLLRTLRKRRYRLVVDLRTNLIGYLVRAEQRLLRTHRRAPGEHAVEQHFAVLAPLLGAALPPPCRLYLDAAAHAQADALLSAWEPAATPGTARWLTIAPGANWPGKRWSGACYRALLERVGDRFEGVIIVGGNHDLDAPLNTAGLAMPVLDLCGRTDLPTAAALIARARAFVGNDSGLGHIAAALGVPTLTVFGPGDPSRYRPWGAKTRVALAPHAALDQLAVGSVIDELDRLLSGT